MPTKQNCKILIVENTALTALRLQMELEKEGYTVMDILANSEDAIEFISQRLPDVVLLDFHLDKSSNGAMVASFLNTYHPTIPIIFLSEYSDDHTIKIVDKTKFYAYLTKPYHTNALLMTVKQAWQIRQERDVTSQEKITFVSEHIEHVLPQSEVLWINTEPLTKGIFISTRQAENQFRVYEPLKGFLNNRELRNFIQISSSYIVNLSYVTEFSSDGKLTIPLKYLPINRNIQYDTPQGRVLKIGKTYKKRLIKYLSE
jgi:DNA-binding LytR/AlgR family response regulator